MFSLKILSVNPPCIVYQSDTKRYLFGCSEGLQRLCVEYKIKLMKVQAICVLDICHPNDIMGFPGLLLTMNDLQKRSLEVIGPQGMQHFIDIIQFFLNRTSVPLFPTYAPKHYISADLNMDLVPIGSNKVCYIGSTPTILGKFDVFKATALKIPRGPLFAQLKKGVSIVLEDGTRIHPEQVVEPTEAGSHFIIVCALHLPEDDHLLSELINSASFSPYQQPDENLARENSVQVMIHLSPASTISNERYKAWTDSFGSSTTHITLSKDNNNGISSNIAATLFNNKLHEVCPDLCPCLPFLEPSVSKSQSQKWIVGSNQLVYTLGPQRKLGLIFPENSEFVESMLTFKKELVGNLELQTSLQIVQEERKKIVAGTLDDPHDVLLRSEASALRNIYFLGTGSAIPCKYRNVSGILLNLEEYSLLLDAGEGSWAQLVALSTAKGFSATETARRLRLAWISHPHADHHLGIIRVAYERKRCLATQTHECFDPLVVIAPPAVLALLEDYSRFDSYFQDAYIGLPCACFDELQEIHLDRSVEQQGQYHFTQRMLERVGIRSLLNCPVDHCSSAYGIAITLSDDLKLVYSGDTVIFYQLRRFLDCLD